MTELFDDITALKTYVGGAVNPSLSITSMGPGFYQAYRKHLRPWLTDPFWAEIKAGLGSPSAELTALLPYLRRAAAYLAVYEYSFIGTVQFSEAGIVRTEGEMMRQAYKYQENAYRNQLIETGYNALEELVDFMEENNADYPTWSASSARALHLSCFVNTTAKFSAGHTRDVSRHTFEALLPLLRDVETFAVRPLLGSDEHDSLRTDWTAGTLNAARTEAVARISNAMVSYAIDEALRRQWIRIEGRRVVQVEDLEPQSYRRTGSAGANAVSFASRHYQEWANRHLSYLTEYLTDNPADFPDYTAKITAEATAAAAAAEDAALTNPDGRRGIVRM